MFKKIISILIISILLLPLTALANENEGSETQSHPDAIPGCAPDRNRSTPNDTDGDCIPNELDNCPNIYNPYQLNRAGHESLGDACNPTFQREFRQSLRRQLDERIRSTQQSISYERFGSCIAEPGSESQGCNYDSSQEKFNNLAKAYQNNLIVSVLEEPISSENIFNRATVCSTRYLRDINGGLQFTDGGRNSGTQLDFDNPDLEQEAQEIVSLAKAQGRPVAIAVDSCRTMYVNTCIPQFTHVREIPYGQDLPQIVSCSQVQLLFADSGADLLKQYVGLIYRWATGIIGVIAVLVIMINGIMISFAQGDDGKVSEAKGRIIQSLSALAILFLAGIILYSINPNFFTTQDLQFDPTVEDFDIPTEPETSDNTDANDDTEDSTSD